MQKIRPMQLEMELSIYLDGYWGPTHDAICQYYVVNDVCQQCSVWPDGYTIF